MPVLPGFPAADAVCRGEGKRGAEGRMGLRRPFRNSALDKFELLTR